jgi:hypothetical protein
MSYLLVRPASSTSVYDLAGPLGKSLEGYTVSAYIPREDVMASINRLVVYTS